MVDLMFINVLGSSISHMNGMQYTHEQTFDTTLNYSTNHRFCINLNLKNFKLQPKRHFFG